ncbi:unnamed protein product, partial [Ectocarpus fasciculatus]
MAGPAETSSRASPTSSFNSSQEFSASGVLSNGTCGVVSSVIWLTISVGLCFPWLLEQPSASKDGDAPKSVAWFLVLAIDLLIGAISVFSLWFRRSTLSIMLLIWGAGGIVATFLMGSFAMLPAVATICCCAEGLCVLGAADISPLDDSFCHTTLEFCMETKWSLWCYYGGILLAMTSIVLLVNSVALHHKTLLDCERRRNEAAKAIRAANRSRRRRQQLWEQEVYGGGGSYAGSLSGARPPSTRRTAGADDSSNAGGSTLLLNPTETSSSRGRGGPAAVAPSFESPTRGYPRKPVATAEVCGGRVTPPVEFAALDPSRDTDIEMSRLGSPTSAAMSQSGQDDEGDGNFGGGGGGGGGEFTIG